MSARGGRRRSVGAGVLTLVVLVATLVGAGVVGAASGPTVASVQQSDDAVLSQATSEADAVVLRADVQSNGSAEWAVEYRFQLENENETAAFEQLQADIEANRTAHLDRFESRIRATVASAENATGRDMAADSFGVRTETRQQFDQQIGIVVYTFQWTNFAVADGPRLEIGDALAGLYLDERTSLVLSWPEGYSEVSVDPPATDREDRTAIWQGEQSFGPGQPTLVVSSGAPATGGGGGPLSATTFGVVGVTAILLVGGYAIYRRRATDAGASRETANGPADGGSGGQASPNVGGDGPTTQATDDPDTEPDERASEEPPEELLSNEERVLRLVRERGGRIKQQEVVSELDWTAAKTSQVVSGMREEGSVEVFRLGRENVIRLPEDDDDDEDASPNGF